MNDPLMQALAQAKEEQSKATYLARALEILGARFDIGTTGRIFSTARLERFWRTSRR